MIQIDHGIPIPPPSRYGRPKGTPNAFRYPWMAMEVGDSFVFPGSRHEAMQRIHGRREFDRRIYQSRQTIENGVQVVRIWRTA